MAYRSIKVCENARNTKGKEISELGQLFRELQEKFEIGFVTLNYDNLITQALPNLYTGFDDAGHFDSASILDRKKWGFIYHTHGSIHFSMSGASHDMHGINLRDSPVKDHTAQASGRNKVDSIEGISHPRSPLVAGYGKTQQILRQPYRTYFSQVNRLVNEADSFLFLGYGFGDLHLNALFSEIKNKSLPIVLVDWAKDNEDSLPHQNDNLSNNLFRTLPINPQFMSYQRHTCAAYIGDLKANIELEV